MKKLVFLACAFIMVNIAFGQRILQNANFTEVTKDNADTKSGVYATVKIGYLVRRVDKSEVFINLSVEDFQINSTQGYGYKGKVYRNEVPGLIQALENARASNPTIIFKVYFGGNVVTTITSSVTAKNNLNGFSGDGFSLPATEEQMKNPNWMVEAMELKSFSLNPDYYTYASIIEKHLKLVEGNSKYKEQISKADRILAAASTKEELLAAKAEFYKAANLAPNEAYPQNQQERIANRIAELEKKEIAAEQSKKEKEEIEKQKDESEKKEKETKNVTTKKAVEKKVIKEKTEEQKQADELEFKRRQKEWETKALEAEGDKYNAMGSMFIDMALEKYNQAQLIYYSATVQAKIDKISSLKIAAKLLNEGAEKVGEFFDDTQSTLDDAGWPRWRVTSFNFEGISPSFKGYQTQKVITPQSFSISTGFYRLIAMEVGLKYQKSPVYKFGLNDNNNRYTGQSIEADFTAIGPEVLIGLAIGGKRAAYYVMYGFYLPFVLSGTAHNPNYKFENDVKDNFESVFVGKLKAGFFYTIPKSRLGVSVYYTLSGLNGEKLLKGGAGNVVENSTNFKYTLGPGENNAVDRLRFSSIGISFIIRARNY
jgi:hypothetical protein